MIIHLTSWRCWQFVFLLVLFFSFFITIQFDVFKNIVNVEHYLSSEWWSIQNHPLMVRIREYAKKYQRDLWWMVLIFLINRFFFNFHEIVSSFNYFLHYFVIRMMNLLYFRHDLDNFLRTHFRRYESKDRDQWENYWTYHRNHTYMEMFPYSLWGTMNFDQEEDNHSEHQHIRYIRSLSSFDHYNR